MSAATPRWPLHVVAPHGASYEVVLDDLAARIRFVFHDMPGPAELAIEGLERLASAFEYAPKGLAGVFYGAHRDVIVREVELLTNVLCRAARSMPDDARVAKLCAAREGIALLREALAWESESLEPVTRCTHAHG